MQKSAPLRAVPHFMDAPVICRHQMPSRHPQIRQHEQRLQLHRVLGQPTISGLGVLKLALDHSERVFNPGAQAGFQVLDLELRTGLAAFHLGNLARTHRN